MSKATKEGKKIKNLVRGTGINLLPPVTQEHVIKEEKKISININAALALLLLVLLTIGIIGYNLYSRLELNAKKEELFALEQRLRARSDILLSNQELNKRIKLYQEIEKSTYSTKDIVDYWNSVAGNLAIIDSIQISKTLSFSVSGQSANINDVAKLWNLLANDERIKSVDLDSVVKDRNNVRFRFEGNLNFEKFSKNAGK